MNTYCYRSIITYFTTLFGDSLLPGDKNQLNIINQGDSGCLNILDKSKVTSVVFRNIVKVNVQCTENRSSNFKRKVIILIF